MLKRIYWRWQLKDGDRRQWSDKNWRIWCQGSLRPVRPSSEWKCPLKMWQRSNIWGYKSKVYGWRKELTPWDTVLLEKLIGRKTVKKFPAIYGTRRFITAFTKTGLMSLSSTFQSMTTHPNSCKSISILSSHLRLVLPSGLLPSGFPTKTLLE